MTAARRKPLAEDVTKPLIIMYADIFYKIMIGMVKAKQFEEEYAEFKEEAQHLTKTQMGIVAEYAAEYFVAQANPSLKKMSRDDTHQLKVKSIRSALKKLSDETK